MSQYHYHPAELDAESRTTALWAIEPNRSLLVFVHGFGGNATGTWVEFPALIADSRARHCDCVFFGYESLRTRAFVSGVKLFEFLGKLCTDTAAVVNSTLPGGAPQREAAFMFDRIVLIAHSLGAIVARQALVHAHKTKAPWAGKVDLVLFAPAHSGADSINLAGEALSFMKGASLKAIGESYAQVLTDLEPASQMLTKLKEAVQKLLPGAPNLAARRVILAENDRYINPTPFIFEDDDPPKLFRGRGHIDCCKPTAQFLDPLREVEALL